MKAVFILSLIAFAFITCEELHFLSDEDAEFLDGYQANIGAAAVVPMIDSILGLAEKAINIFKSSKTSEIKERIEGKGFNYFKGGCTVQQSQGILVNRYDSFMERLLKRLHVPAERVDEIRSQMQDLLDVDTGIAFKVYDLIFNADSVSNDAVHSTSFIGRYNERMTIDLFYTSMHADFKLAPDIMIMQEAKSYVGGIWSENIQKIVKVPKTLSAEDIKVVLSYFEVVALQQFGDMFGIKIPSL